MNLLSQTNDLVSAVLEKDREILKGWKEYYKEGEDMGLTTPTSIEVVAKSDFAQAFCDLVLACKEAKR